MSNNSEFIAASISRLQDLRTQFDACSATIEQPEEGFPNFIRATSEFSIGADYREDLEPYTHRQYVNEYLAKTTEAVARAYGVTDVDELERISKNCEDVEEDVFEYLAENSHIDPNFKVKID